MKQQFTEKKLNKACGGCPFKRVNNNSKPHPGGSHPAVYLGQARGPFWLPCHADKNYDSKNSDPATVKQCAGAAIFRANCQTETKLKGLLKLPADKERVFSNEAEFMDYYLEIGIEEAKSVLTPRALDMLLRIELNDAKAKHFK